MHCLYRCVDMDPSPTSPQAPILSGWLLRMFVWVMETRLGWLLYPTLAKSSGLSQVLHVASVWRPCSDALAGCSKTPLNCQEVAAQHRPTSSLLFSQLNTIVINNNVIII